MNHSLRRTMIAIPMAVAITLTGTTGALATKASTEPTTSAAGPAAAAIGGGPELMEGTPEQIQAAFEAINKHRAAQGVAPVKYSTVLSATLFNDPPPGYTASGGNAGAVAGDELDHAGVEAAVWVIDETPTDTLTDERWTHVGIGLDYSAEDSLTYFAIAFYAYPVDQSVPGTYASPEEAFADDVPPTPTPEPTPVPTAPPFTDVDPKQEHYKEMAWLAESKISTGWDNGDGTASYKPLTPVNRDAMAAFLYRLAGSPDYTAPAKSPFTDVSPKQEHYKEMAWLAESKISTGWDNGDGTASYKPLTPVNRDAMATFLYRMADSPQYTAPATPVFKDVKANQEHYKEMAWLAESKISTGWVQNDGTASYKPLTPVNRDAMAAFLYRYAHTIIL